MALPRSEACIIEDGVFFLDDPEVGDRFQEMNEKRFAFKTVAGVNFCLDFCRSRTLEDDRIRCIIESFFKRSGLGLLKLYGPQPDIIFTFLNNPSNEASEESSENTKGKQNVKVLLVLLLSKNSTVEFYKRSHLHVLQADIARIGLLQVAPENLESEEIESCEVTMEAGGFAIIDGRLAFRIIKGQAIIVGFGVDEEVKEWNKMRFPREVSIIEKVRAMNRERIFMNVLFS
ncbi:hypothetical protein TUN199_01295 [Pyrenophora tritici-repentis]|uniref:Uncharacterized protein n=1 Tax=Pyrenophora tritici-repentis TaxID=45151 RepID=A0A2W1EJ34_9PLEO|nr:hypothetical protein PtrV1_13839 [Pyrenophora tritici-repentis]KAF7569473.1 hypothetical protein PtrM4_118880 [Pyrenophora tritici-repentis]KAI0586773.1 hypothetical protein Alg215_01811 [Pyrenophora tritici-repentis]KAI0626741.1 hypothetical protein TUN199_01295 [Pyrenophora tritici-repentis]KAI1533008.1 hypothetical protein PtrSN001C_007763 [Pyrenophora tritici-repentis]